jgi:hypothetical protein
MRAQNYPTMKPFKLFVLLGLSISLLPLEAQVNVFKFAKTGSSTDPLWSDCDTVGNNYLIGRFNTSFEYQGVVVTGNTTFENGNNLFILKASLSGKPNGFVL